MVCIRRPHEGPALRSSVDPSRESSRGCSAQGLGRAWARNHTPILPPAHHLRVGQPTLRNLCHLPWRELPIIPHWTHIVAHAYEERHRTVEPNPPLTVQPASTAKPPNPVSHQCKCMVDREQLVLRIARLRRAIVLNMDTPSPRQSPTSPAEDVSIGRLRVRLELEVAKPRPLKQLHHRTDHLCDGRCVPVSSGPFLGLHARNPLLGLLCPVSMGRFRRGKGIKD